MVIQANWRGFVARKQLHAHKEKHDYRHAVKVATALGSDVSKRSLASGSPSSDDVAQSKVHFRLPALCASGCGAKGWRGRAGGRGASAAGRGYGGEPVVLRRVSGCVGKCLLESFTWAELGALITASPGSPRRRRNSARRAKSVRPRSRSHS